MRGQYTLVRKFVTAENEVIENTHYVPTLEWARGLIACVNDRLIAAAIYEGDVLVELY